MRMKFEFDVPTAAKIAIAAVGAWWGEIGVFWQTLVLLIAVDYATGLLAAAVTKTVSSNASFDGLMRKTLIMLFVAMGEILEPLILATTQLPIKVPLGEALALFFCINEAISITENAARANLPVPKWLRELLVKAQATTSEAAKL